MDYDMRTTESTTGLSERRASRAAGAERRGGEPATADRLLAKVRDFCREVAPRVAEIEAGRRIPADIADQLRATGVFGMFVPKSHGGLEIAFPDSLDVAEALAEVDGSLGWVGMICSHFPMSAASLPRASFDRLYANGPDLWGAGSVYLGGTAVLVDGGYAISGRWPFASGCQNADYILGGYQVADKDADAGGDPAAVKPWRMFVAPARDWQIEDTWYVAGLKGTGSNHVSLKDYFVPADMTFEFFTAPSNVEGPLYGPGSAGLSMLHIGAVAIGIARGAIADVVATAGLGRKQVKSSVALKDSPVFHRDLGHIEADVRAADAYLRAQSKALWQDIVEGEAFSPSATIHASQATTWVVATCARAVEQLYVMGGGSALYETSPLQRRLRDMHGVTQHQAAHPASYGMAGRVRLGFADVDPWTGI